MGLQVGLEVRDKEFFFQQLESAFLSPEAPHQDSPSGLFTWGKWLCSFTVKGLPKFMATPEKYEERRGFAFQLLLCQDQIFSTEIMN